MSEFVEWYAVRAYGSRLTHAARVVSGRVECSRLREEGVPLCLKGRNGTHYVPVQGRQVNCSRCLRVLGVWETQYGASVRRREVGNGEREAVDGVEPGEAAGQKAAEAEALGT